MIQIKSRCGGKVLKEIDAMNLSCACLVNADLSSADLRVADLRGANLKFANLRGADLRKADLRFADLGDANLRYAILSSADLRSANLRSADLSNADLSNAELGAADLRFANLSGADLSNAKLWLAELTGVITTIATRFSSSPLTLLFASPIAHSYKATSEDGMSPTYHRRIAYVVGEEVEAILDRDKSVECGAGISLSDLGYIARHYDPSQGRLFLCSFETDDSNVCIPYPSDGKFRVGKAKVEAELDFEATMKAMRPVLLIE